MASPTGFDKEGEARRRAGAKATATRSLVSNPIFLQCKKITAKRKSNNGQIYLPSCCLLFAGITHDS